jgi:hypothetical protein
MYMPVNSNGIIESIQAFPRIKLCDGVNKAGKKQRGREDPLHGTLDEKGTLKMAEKATKKQKGDSPPRCVEKMDWQSSFIVWNQKEPSVVRQRRGAPSAL